MVHTGLHGPFGLLFHYRCNILHPKLVYCSSANLGHFSADVIYGSPIWEVECLLPDDVSLLVVIDVVVFVVVFVCLAAFAAALAADHYGVVVEVVCDAATAAAASVRIADVTAIAASDWIRKRA